MHINTHHFWELDRYLVSDFVPCQFISKRRRNNMLADPYIFLHISDIFFISTPECRMLSGKAISILFYLVWNKTRDISDRIQTRFHATTKATSTVVESNMQKSTCQKDIYTKTTLHSMYSRNNDKKE